MFSQMLDVPVRDSEVTDLLLPPAHQPPHRVKRQDGALAGQQLQAGDEEDQEQHLHPFVILRETG